MVQGAFSAAFNAGFQPPGDFGVPGRGPQKGGARAEAYAQRGDATAIARSGNGAPPTYQAQDYPPDSYQPAESGPRCDDALKQLIGRFDEFDRNHDGALEDDELADAQTKMKDCQNEIGAIRDNREELMFSSVDPGNAAWHGLTKNDLNVMKDKRDTQAYPNQGDDLRSKISKERRVPGDFNGFRGYVRDTAASRPI